MGNSIVTQRDTQLEKQRAGYIKLSLTNFTTSAEPTIAAGSVVEISGSLYSFTTNESITGWASVGVGDAYIKLVPDGTNPCTAEFTATAPTWSDAKQGWYDATGTDRYVAGLYKTSATEYDRKHIFSERDSPTLNGDNTFSGDNTFNKVITFKHNYKNTSITSDDMFIALNSWVPNVGDYISASGQITQVTSDHFIVGMKRSSTTLITITAIGIFSNIENFGAESGSSLSYAYIDISSNFNTA